MKNWSWLNFVLGLWLIVAPVALLYRGVTNAFWQDVIVGIIIAALSLWRALAKESDSMTIVSWVVALAGLWTLISPFVLAYRQNTAALWNNVIVGIAVALIALYRASQDSHFQITRTTSR